jgi:hypothetical protein
MLTTGSWCVQLSLAHSTPSLPQPTASSSATPGLTLIASITAIQAGCEDSTGCPSRAGRATCRPWSVRFRLVMLKTSSKMLIVLAACLLALAGQSQAYKVMVAPGKTECISQNMEAAHFEVSTLSLGLRFADTACLRSEPHCCSLLSPAGLRSSTSRGCRVCEPTVPQLPAVHNTAGKNFITSTGAVASCSCQQATLGAVGFVSGCPSSCCPNARSQASSAHLQNNLTMKFLDQPVCIPVPACSCTARLASRSGHSKASHQKHTSTSQHTGQACTSCGKHLPRNLLLSSSAA